MRISAPELAGVSALVTCLLALALFSVDRGYIDWPPAVILIVGALLRLLFVFRAPELSDDIYRYLWDGVQILSGHNPYTLSPAAVIPATAELANLLRQVNHPEYVTIYPPVAQIFFAGGAVGSSVSGMKLMLMLLDLITCFMLIRLLPCLGLHPSRAVLYAWHPLPVLEIAASGHIDGAGVFLIVLTLTLLQGSGFMDRPEKNNNRQRLFFAGITFSWAALVKLLPFVFLPGLLMLIRRGGKKIFLAGAIAGGVAVTIPFLPDIGNGLNTLGIYIHNWEFSGFLFRTLRQSLSSGSWARLILAFVFMAVLALLHLRPVMRNSAKAGGTSKEPGLEAGVKIFYAIVISFLLLTPTLHPWYALYLALFLPFSAGVVGLVLSWSVLLSYRVLIFYAITGQWIEEDLLPAVIWLAPVCAGLVYMLILLLRDRQLSKL